MMKKKYIKPEMQVIAYTFQRGSWNTQLFLGP